MKFINSLLVVCAIALAQTSVIEGQEELNVAFTKCVLSQIDEVLPIGSLSKEWEDYRVSLKEVVNKAAENITLRYVQVYFDSAQINLS